ncbi:MAG: hypothetical protein IPL65_14450 [Lewinellaceae bacterium]|nr:hypothetical protein [Lewinellaceae bacterium]
MKPFSSIFLLLLCSFARLLHKEAKLHIHCFGPNREILKSDMLSADRSYSTFCCPATPHDRGHRLFSGRLCAGWGLLTEDFIHIVGLLQFLNMCRPALESIVIGIANIG